MSLAYAPSPHKSKAENLGAFMRQVVWAAVPGAVALFWAFGWGVVFQVWMCCFTAIATEALVLALRRRPIRPALTDCTALVTGVLLGLALPPYAPWWCAVFGSGFAILFGKQVYGGMGFNPFNPAMLGYVLLLVSFPVQMTIWATPLDLVQRPMGLWDGLSLVWLGETTNHETLVSLHSGIDAWTSASPLDHVKTQLGQGYSLSEALDTPIARGFSGFSWEWVNLAFGLGGLYLCVRKIADWRIPAGMLAALFVLASGFSLTDSDRYTGPIFQLFNGATMLGAFFIATDPVTAATTPRGRWLFGIGIGVLVYVIRTFGGYPDGMAFAVLLMNLAAPTLDYLTIPTAYGHGEEP
ncbi:MAG: electron transport complex subunit RsxD [Gammaproteobacteria bacterium]|nr:electron transport complex subunit RsxD [Gammaproteobacteria bacterium]